MTTAVSTTITVTVTVAVTWGVLIGKRHGGLGLLLVLCMQLLAGCVGIVHATLLWLHAL